jgi:flagellar biosynthesis anti-sigma factor FlgM
MRIDSQNQIPASPEITGVENAQSGQAKGIQKPISGEPSDTVQLSSDQATVRQLVSQLGQVPDVRQGPVNTLRSAIASGKYNPSNEQVAGSLADQLFGASEPA